MKRKLAIGCLTPVLIALIAAGVFAYRQHRYIAHVTAKAKAMGVPMTLAELEAALPNPADEDNAGVLYMEAIELLMRQKAETPNVERAADERLPIVGRQAPEGPPWNDEIMPEAIAYLDKRGEALRLIHEAVQRPECRFPNLIESIRAIEMDVDRSAGLREMARLLHLDATTAVWAGRGADAARAVESGLRMTAHLDGERSYTGLLVRQTVAGIILKSAEETIASGKLAADDLRRIEAALLPLTDSGGLVPALEGELVYHLEHRAMLSAMRWLDRAAWAEEEFPGLFRTAQSLAETLGGYAHYREAEWQLRLIEAANAPFPELLYNLDALQTAYDASGDDRVIANHVFGGGPEILRLTPGVAAHARLLHTLCAIERYRIDHGRAPATLDALVPACLDAVPIDPCDGQPIRDITAADGGRILYSIGVNRVDDGGTAGKLLFQSDIVVTVRP